MHGPEYTRESLKAQIAAGQAEVGEYTYGAPGLGFVAPGRRFICGRYCSISNAVVVFLGGDHYSEWVTTYAFPAYRDEWPSAQGKPFARSRGNVVVGNDVWIGYGATILAGVTIGDGAVIGARAVVTKDVPPYAIAAGNPAQIIRFRFDEQTIRDLLEIAWWNWPKDRVESNIGLLMAGDIQAFIAKARADDAAPQVADGARAGGRP